MSTLRRACLGCGRPVRGRARCATCAPTTTAARGYDSAWRALVARVLHRDGYRCAWCGGPATTGDHLVPLADGGARLDPGNVVAACLSCNSRRGAHTSRTPRPRVLWQGAGP